MKSGYDKHVKSNQQARYWPNLDSKCSNHDFYGIGMACCTTRMLLNCKFKWQCDGRSRTENQKKLFLLPVKSVGVHTLVPCPFLVHCYRFHRLFSAPASGFVLNAACDAAWMVMKCCCIAARPQFDSLACVAVQSLYPWDFPSINKCSFS